MARKPLPESPDPEMDMSPMIDMSFLLLIYFLVTSTLEPIEGDLYLTMPGTSTEPGKEVVIDKVEVELNPAGHVVYNKEVLDTDPDSRELPLLLDRLKTYVETAKLTNSDPTVILSADDAAKGQRFVDILNTLAHPAVNIQKVTIAGFSE